MRVEGAERVAATFRHRTQVLEGVAFQCDEVIQAMVADSGAALAKIRVDGGVAQSDMLCGFQADVPTPGGTHRILRRCASTSGIGGD